MVGSCGSANNLPILAGPRYDKLMIRAIAIFATAICALAQSNPEWTTPFPAHRVIGNVYYVGTYDLACFLITTPGGNILINTGMDSSAPMIKSSIESLGFKLKDTKILLTTQAHVDHVGAMAELEADHRS